MDRGRGWGRAGGRVVVHQHILLVYKLFWIIFVRLDQWLMYWHATTAARVRASPPASTPSVSTWNGMRSTCLEDGIYSNTQVSAHSKSTGVRDLWYVIITWISLLVNEIKFKASKNYWINSVRSIFRYMRCTTKLMLKWPTMWAFLQDLPPAQPHFPLMSEPMEPSALPATPKTQLFSHYHQTRWLALQITTNLYLCTCFLFLLRLPRSCNIWFKHIEPSPKKPPKINYMIYQYRTAIKLHIEHVEDCSVVHVFCILDGLWTKIVVLIARRFHQNQAMSFI